MNNFAKLALVILLVIGIGFVGLNLWRFGGEIPKGWTELHSACYECRYKGIEIALENGADPNGESEKGTPLMALFGGTPNSDLERCLELLLKKGAKIDHVFHGSQPIHRLAYNVRSVALLLKHGADVNAQDRRKKTLLHIECEGIDHPKNESNKIIKFILEHGANPLIKDDKNETPADVARREGNVTALKILEEFMQRAPFSDNKPKSTEQP